MATWRDVSRLALRMPEAVETEKRGQRVWMVKDKYFVWERPLRRSDLEALGEDAPTGPILGARVEHLGAKEALIQSEPEVFFTTPHFEGYPAVLIKLPQISKEILEEIVVEAWVSRAPKRLVKGYLDGLSKR